MKTVLAFGTYDLFHKGHEFFLTEAAKQGDRLVVIVARGSNVERIKGRAPEQSDEERLAAVSAYALVAEARLGYEDWERRLDVLSDVKPDVICLGYDQQARIPDGDWDVVRIESFEPERYKSSLLRKT